MNTTLSHLFFLAGSVILILLTGSFAAVGSDNPSSSAKHYGPVPPPDLGRYELSSSCNSCHEKIYKQFSESMHAESFRNKAFKAEFFGKLLPRAQGSKALSEEAAACIACHSPVTYARTSSISSEIDVNPEVSGVECDFCHTITGFTEPGPGGGNYVTQPGKIKFGPFETKTDWHRAYAELQTKSEICAICHNRVNRYGLEIISTFSEWQKSRYAQRNIQCQDCHMNIQGFLTGGQPVYDTGSASQNTLARSPVRSKLFTHRFPGAHSETQVKGAMQLDLKVEKAALSRGKEIEVQVIVDNSKSGHKMPTGSAELRLLYLDLTVQSENTTFSVPADSLYQGMHDVAGRGKFDRDVIGNDIPDGSRLYRAICTDPDGQQTLYSFDAIEIFFDNRLMADEIRKEIYRFTVPEDVEKTLLVTARLYYLRYPTSFSEELDIPPVKPVELASVQQELSL